MSATVNQVKSPANSGSTSSLTVAEALRSDRADWRYVVVPKKDVLGRPHPGIRLNEYHYGPGQHLLPPAVADTVEERLETFDTHTRRILQPTLDSEAVDTMTKQGMGVVDGSKAH